MKKILFSLFLLSACFSGFSQGKIDSVIQKTGQDIVNATDNRAIICILNFSSPTREMSDYLQTQLTSAVMETGRVQVVTRSNMDKIDKELNFQTSGYVSDETALSICKRLGASAIVFGEIAEIDNKYDLRLRMLNVESAAYILFKTYSFSRSSKSEQLLGRAQNYCKGSLGLIAEANKNSVSGIAPGAGLYFDYNFTRKFTTGFKTLISYDAFYKKNTIYTFEPLGFLRFYLVSPSGEPSTGLFIEGDIGASLIFIDTDAKSAFNGGASLGFRKEFGSFYLEPALRLGYPYILGGGINVGLRF